MNPTVSPAEARLTLIVINEQRAQNALKKLIAINNDLVIQGIVAPFHLGYAITHCRELIGDLETQRQTVASQIQYKRDRKNETSATKI